MTSPVKEPQVGSSGMFLDCAHAPLNRQTLIRHSSLLKKNIWRSIVTVNAVSLSSATHCKNLSMWSKEPLRYYVMWCLKITANICELYPHWDTGQSCKVPLMRRARNLSPNPREGQPKHQGKNELLGHYLLNIGAKYF